MTFSNKSKLLYISISLSNEPNGGKFLTETNLSILKNIAELDVSVLSIGRNDTGYINIKSTSSTVETGLMNLRLYSGGLTRSALLYVLDYVAQLSPDIIFFDTSLFGRLALEIKKSLKKVKIITFFQNVEFDFKWHYKSGWRRLLYTPAILSDWMNERWAIQNSDIIVALHRTDSNRLNELYGRQADFIHPVCLADNSVCDLAGRIDNNSIPDEYLLFVGSAFLANIEGLRFLTRSVMPRLKEHLVVVGSNFENYRQEFAAENVTVIGSVSDLAPYYAGAKCVLAPIFTGAGMKVKVADALMHGKCVIGSGFSFIGYEKAIEQGVCVACESAVDFVSAVNHFQNSNVLEQVAKDVFKEEFSYDAGRRRLKSIISQNCAI